MLALWGVLVSLRFEPPCAHSGHTTNLFVSYFTQLPAQLRFEFCLVLVCLSADWTGSPVLPFNPLPNQGTVNSFFGCVCPQTGQVHSHLLLLPVQPLFCFSVLVCLSADWTGSPVPFSQPPAQFSYSNTFFGCVCPQTGQVHSPPFFVRLPVQPRFSFTVLVCLSADWTGALAEGQQPLKPLDLLGSASRTSSLTH